MIELFFEDTEILDLDPEFFVSWLSKVVVIESKKLGDINLIFCSDDYLLEVNRKYLDHDYYTDIITFDYCLDDEIKGDLFISIDRVMENAKEHSTSFSNELNRVVVHGVLHLIGYGDKSPDEKTVMTSKENFYLDYVSRETL